MTTDNTPTEVTATTAADAADTELLKTAAADHGDLAALAWTAADDGEVDAHWPRHGGRLRWAIAISLVCIAMAAVAVLSGVFYQERRPQQPMPPTITVVAVPGPGRSTGRHGGPSSGSLLTAGIAAERIKAAIPSVTLAALTGDNDANHLLGRPNGYVAATVIVDPRSDGLCDQGQPGVDCGATVEQWPDAAAAQRRATYIQTIQGAAPVLGNEYDTLRGNLLLRVVGRLSPTVADQYRAAFTAA